ncbi:hypothetical protein [Leifsonia xyli]|uniref:hypothetical protein n=1 Tax=Leifsonia xyli TaxID=1575 RepID=UPI003D6788F8
MTTDEEYAGIAQAAYYVDPKWANPPWASGRRFPTQHPRFIILDDPAPVSDPVTGLQGIAVAPLVNGEPDYGHVFVAFAGTNPADHADLNADSQEVVAGKSVEGTQAAEAKAYAKKVRSRVLAKHPEATFDTVGHSLGAT